MHFKICKDTLTDKRMFKNKENVALFNFERSTWRKFYGSNWEIEMSFSQHLKNYEF